MSTKLSKAQVSAIKKAGLSVSKTQAEKLINNDSLWSFQLNEIALLLEIANATYRAGFPVVSDSKYDLVFLQGLKSEDPKNIFLNTVEPESIPESKTVALPVKMLSTDKAYSVEDIRKWVDRVLKAAKETNIDESSLILRVTPKLDGYAAYDDGEKLYTRGDGVRGQDITRAFNRGLKVANDALRGEGAGEIVISKSYFDEYLSNDFENSRNIQASIIAEKKVDKKIQKAIDEEACVFYPFSTLVNWEDHCSKLLEDFDSIIEGIWTKVDYEVDGVIIEVIEPKIKEQMGATRHHHRWQIAYKVNEEKAEVEVLNVIPQTSRTGKLTPVAHLKPTKLSGAIISRATVHHYGMVKSKGVGKGAIVELVRSGLVIPKIERVIKKVDPDIPAKCPSCGSNVVWDGDNLYCPNTTECSAQAENTLIHFFKTLGNVDGFGPIVISRLYEAGISSLHSIYSLKQDRLVKIGFGDKTADNLVSQLKASRTIEIEDWRFLAAFGVPRLGGGNCERLLEHHNITEIFGLEVSDMMAMDGFAEISATTIYEGLQSIEKEFNQIYDLGFKLKSTIRVNGQKLPLCGEVLVFTGTMERGKRSDMEAEVKALGAKVGKSVSGKTTYLVTGKNVGENKINAAKEKGSKVLTEVEYLAYIQSKKTSAT
jgi:DNA ligase (NAD+)